MFVIFRYLPEKVLREINDLSEGSKKEINDINIHLVHQLKSADTAFSLGELRSLFLVMYTPNSPSLGEHRSGSESWVESTTSYTFPV